MFVAVAVLAGALLWLTVASHLERTRTENAHAAERDQLSLLIDVERERVSDLLNRLAARNLPEYQAYQADPDPAPAKTYWSDDFGLVTTEARD